MTDPRLLVIDDSLTIRKLVDLSFRATGWSVDYAASGKEGITKAIAQPPDLILLDYLLPDMRGVEVCTVLARSEKASAAPIIVMSAKGEVLKSIFADTAVVDFLSKPFTAAQILARAKSALERKPKDVSAPASPALSRERKEAAAKLIYNALRSRLGMIPSWMTAMGSTPPSIYFGRKILTPELVDEVIQALIPFYRELLAEEQTKSSDRK